MAERCNNSGDVDIVTGVRVPSMRNDQTMKQLKRESFFKRKNAKNLESPILRRISSESNKIGDGIRF